MKKRIIIMGVGNYIMSDDGIGVHVLMELEKSHQFGDNVELFDCGTMGMLANYKFGEADIMIAIDSIAIDAPYGSVHVYDKDQIRLLNLPTKMSSHQLGFQETLLHAELRGDAPSVVKLVGIVPKSYDSTTELSPECRSSIPEVISTVKRLIAELDR